MYNPIKLRVHCFLYLLSMIFSFAAAGNPIVNHSRSLFIFGDSFLDTGNNNYINTSTFYQANFRPYGTTYFRHPTGRFSDGRLISDFIAAFSDLPVAIPYLQPRFTDYERGVNFASGGAGALVDTFKGYVIDLKTQVNYFKKVKTHLLKVTGNEKAESIISRAVFLISIGFNDYSSQFLSDSVLLRSGGVSDYVGMVIGNMSQEIREIYDAGGRNFAVMNLPPLGCFPNLRLLNLLKNRSGCYTEVQVLASAHNRALPKMLHKLEKELTGFKYSLLLLNSLFRQRLKNLSQYGFKNSRSACCGSGKFRGEFSCGGNRSSKEYQVCENPNEYLFWDSIHANEMAYRQIANEIWEEPPRSGKKGPRSLQELFH